MPLVIVVDDLNQVVFVPAVAHDIQAIGRDERRRRGGPYWSPQGIFGLGRLEFL